MPDRRPQRVAKTTAQAKLAGATPAHVPTRNRARNTPVVKGEPLALRANGRDKVKGEQPRKQFQGCSLKTTTAVGGLRFLLGRSAPRLHATERKVTISRDPRAEAVLEHPKAAKRIKQEAVQLKPAVLAANKLPARAAGPRLAAAAPQQPVKVEKQLMPAAEPAEDAGEVAEEDEENLHPVPTKVSAQLAAETCTSQRGRNLGVRIRTNIVCANDQ